MPRTSRRQSVAPRRAALPSLLVVVAGIVAGCGFGSPAPPPLELGDLPHLRRTHDRGLLDELARIEAEGGTPRLLTDATELAVSGPPFHQQFPRDQVRRWRESLDLLWPVDREQPDDRHLPALRRLVESADEPRRSYRRFTAAPAAAFGLRHVEGLLANTAFIDAAVTFHRLERADFLLALAAGNRPSALESLHAQLAIGQQLGRTAHIAARLAAADLNQHTVRRIEQFAASPLADRLAMLALQERVREHLAAWPDDARAWIGDRALGLHAYELVRAGDLLSLLDEHEYQQLQRAGPAEQAAYEITAGVDRDQQYYLETMRQLIDGCRRPYHEQIVWLAELNQRTTDWTEQHGQPFVAERLLLAGVAAGRARQAEDRALWEALTVALALALDERPPPLAADPLTGQPYRSEATDASVVVYAPRRNDVVRLVRLPRWPPE